MLTVLYIQNIEAWTQWHISHWGRLQMHFQEWKILDLQTNIFGKYFINFHNDYFSKENYISTNLLDQEYITDGNKNSLKK